MYTYSKKKKKIWSFLSAHFLTRTGTISIPEMWIWDSSVLNICQKQTYNHKIVLDKILLLHIWQQRDSATNHYSLNTVVKMLNIYKALSVGFSYARTNLQITIMKKIIIEL